MARRRYRRRRRFVVAAASTVALAAGSVYAVTSVFDGSDDAPKSGTDRDSIVTVVQAASTGKQAVGHVRAEPEASSSGLVLEVPSEVEPEAEATFDVSWASDDGARVTGEVEIQQAEKRHWVTVATVDVEAGSGSTAVTIPKSDFYRAVYGGSADHPAVESATAVVLTGKPIASRLVATVEKGDDDDAAMVTAGWITKSTMPIVGELELQVKKDGKWKPVTTVETDKDGTASVEVEASETSSYRYVYAGGSRFEKTASEPATLVGGDVNTIPVTACTTTGELDVLGNGEACHWTNVSAGTFVVGHDYLGNAWWNTVEVGAHIQLEGEQAGLYEVVDRVFAPGRGSELGSASNWTCGDECDVILQTCRGANTGFTWLRRVDVDA